MSEHPTYEPPEGLPEHLSPSQINSLMTCGHQYWLERVARVPARPMIASVGGSTFHTITERKDLEWYERNHPEQR